MSGFVKIAINDYYSDNNWTTIIKKYWMEAERVSVVNYTGVSEVMKIARHQYILDNPDGNLTEQVKKYWVEAARVSDPRVEGWFLFDTPLATLAMVIVYLAFVMVVGPLWMANRKPMKLQKALVGYNAAQVLLSSYMFYEHLMSGWWADYSLTCQPVDYSDSEKARRMLHLCWVYYFSKLSEFADTVFFVLRKKKNQISWLHLYHHSLTPFEAWVLVKFIAGGHGTFSNIVNNLVHVIMYGYYMVAAMGPQYHKYLWWKKQLTTLQLVQFIIVLFHSISALFNDCGYPKIIAAGLVLHSSIFIVLFTNFYIQAYKPKVPAKVESSEDSQNNNNGNLSNGHAKTNGHVKDEATESGHVKNGFTNGYVLNGTNKQKTQ